MKKYLVIAFTLFVPGLVFAQTNPVNACSGSSIGSCVNQIYIWSMGVAAVLALFMIVVGGYITLTSAGNADRASRGKSYITSSIIGLVLLFGAYLLLRTINPDLVDFSNNCVNNLDSCRTTQNPGTTTQPPRQ